MKCRRRTMDANVVKYEIGKGLEDGFEPYTDVVTKGWFVTDNLVQIKKDSGLIISPYINDRRGRIFICEGDYIIEDADHTKHVCGADKIWNRYEKVEE